MRFASPKQAAHFARGKRRPGAVLFGADKRNRKPRSRRSTRRERRLGSGGFGGLTKRALGERTARDLDLTARQEA
jgi:hypothetical protein